MSIVITGAGGQLGQALQLTAPARLTGAIRALRRADLDITDARAVASSPLLEGAQLVLNCAADTAVDAAEDPECAGQAEAVNALAPELLAARCAAEGAHLVHVSTDYVFGAGACGPTLGTDDAAGGAARRPLRPSDPTCPESVYGRTKLAGERAVLDGTPAATVVRTAWVFSGALLPEHRDFVSTMLRLARAGKDPAVVCDQVGSPTYVADLARALWRLCALRLGYAPAAEYAAEAKRLPARGVVHAVGAGQASWFEVAREVFAAAGYDPERVASTDSAGYPQKAPRPAWSVLCSDFNLPEWRSGIARAVAARL
ncbi:hypothetical protein CATYP_02700 [Corynebacterium atypicum]|uniref:dTDP-4-dehydrorhamnose reductase n=1 Tax=Corynebacterium atypicum TaxID=191610 RepID=A0ABM5QLW3_9CORY|nr:sugar nucleotide-binding protein [Corynebacterium atypicum]AIG63770.1 hypothetical protein CATYP_02700 [Corynebacterium atypicum]